VSSFLIIPIHDLVVILFFDSIPYVRNSWHVLGQIPFEFPSLSVPQHLRHDIIHIQQQ